MIYFDYLSTTPCDPTVMAAMQPWFTDDFGNAGSLHLAGKKAESAVEEARNHVAKALGVSSREIVFTSGATESNNLAIKGAVRFLRYHGDTRRRVVTVATEHKCVLESVRDLVAEGFEPVVLPVAEDGRLAPEVLREALKESPLLVSIMAANNETGVLHDLSTLAPIVKESGAVLHVDMAQAVGKTPVDLSLIDLASVSGHKLYAPKGIGALYIRHRPRVRVQPLFSGGGQERGLRSGTLPVPLIVGLGEALVCAIACREKEAAQLTIWRDWIIDSLKNKCDEIVVNGENAPRLPGVLSLRLPKGFLSSEVMAQMPNVACSTGSACSSASGAPSYVLESMGLSSEESQRSLRLSIGRFTSRNEIDCVLAQLVTILGRRSTQKTL